ncbi:nucleoside recognition protein [Haloarcula salina]|uniref:Nucleoside recognition protein n=1 Tax=Haloarcula salina TaxID=1429914 RepID=A0AA41FWU4_9EURY|nr:nucleoside recognition protein [Haloarcula salina]MBV0900260.1 nucleoside recognition protein [Haloarcula salina]
MQSLVAAVLGHPAAAVLADVVVRVLRITVFLSLGVFLAELAVAFGLVEKIAVVSRTLTAPANLPDEVGTAILTTTASTTAGYGMLADFRESGVLSDRATLVAVTINTFFGFAQHIVTFYAPVLIPILGLRVGVLYVATRGLVALAITLTGIAAGALLLDASNVGRASADASPDGGTAEPSATAGETDPADVLDDPPESRRAAVRTALAETGEKVRDILPRLAVIYAVVSLLVAYGDELLALAGRDAAGVTAAADGFAGLLGLPGAAIPVIAAYALDTTSGATVIAPLIRNGTFTARTAVATMLVGGIISFAVSTFKRSIPFQFGIWGREFGAKVVAVNTALKIVWIAAALVVLL